MASAAATSNAIRDEYWSSLADLDQNSKPMIDMLTMLAEDHRQYAPIIVDAIKQRITQVRANQKLPLLYLIDSIVKNVGEEYKQLFQQEIVAVFADVFLKVRSEKIREKMFALRETWNDVFLPTKLYTLDMKVNQIDPNWPIMAKATPKNPKIHVNPNFLKKMEPVDPIEQLKQEVLEKQRKLLELQQCKLELEMREASKKIEEEQRKRGIIESVPVIPPTTQTIVAGSSAPAITVTKPVKVAPVSSALMGTVATGGTKTRIAHSSKEKKTSADGKATSSSSSSATKKSSSVSSSSKSSPKSSTKSGSSSKGSSSHRSSSSSSKRSDSDHHRKKSSKRSSDESAEKSPTKRSRSSASDSKAKAPAKPIGSGDTDDRIAAGPLSALKPDGIVGLGLLNDMAMGPTITPASTATNQSKTLFDSVASSSQGSGPRGDDDDDGSDQSTSTVRAQRACGG